MQFEGVNPPHKKIKTFVWQDVSGGGFSIKLLAKLFGLIFNDYEQKKSFP